MSYNIKTLKEIIVFTRKIKTAYINTKKLSVFLREIESYQGESIVKIAYPKEPKKKSKVRIGPNIRVIDVRANTYFKSRDSSRNPEQWFNPSNLESKLNEREIQYIYWKDLGNPKELRKKYKPDFDNLNEDELIKIEKAKSEYLDYIPTKDLNDLFSIIDKSKHINILMCYCDPPEVSEKYEKYVRHNYCHRFWLKQALINQKRRDIELRQDYNCNYFIQEEIIARG